jgi:hypothetical protein
MRGTTSVKVDWRSERLADRITGTCRREQTAPIWRGSPICRGRTYHCISLRQAFVTPSGPYFIRTRHYRSRECCGLGRISESRYRWRRQRAGAVSGCRTGCAASSSWIATSSPSPPTSSSIRCRQVHAAWPRRQRG